MADGMLPEELAPWRDEWYRLCERAPHVGRIGISGELAEAIVNCVSRLTRHGAGDAEEGSLRFIAKRNLRRMIEIGSTDTKTMLLCLEELS